MSVAFDRVIPLLVYRDIQAAHDFLVMRSASSLAASTVPRTARSSMPKCASGTRPLASPRDRGACTRLARHCRRRGSRSRRLCFRCRSALCPGARGRCAHRLGAGRPALWAAGVWSARPGRPSLVVRYASQTAQPEDSDRDLHLHGRHGHRTNRQIRIEPRAFRSSASQRCTARSSIFAE